LSVKICVKFRNGVLFPRNVAEALVATTERKTTFGRVEMFDPEINLAKQMGVEKTMKVFGVSAASGRRREGWKRGKKRDGGRYESGLSERSFFLSRLSAKIKSAPAALG
jgi:CO dehydrogenase nickel-insertion accessory protein CooC1